MRGTTPIVMPAPHDDGVSGAWAGQERPEAEARAGRPGPVLLRRVPTVPVIGLLVRRVLGLFRRSRALWRRSIQLRVVATTLVLSLGVVLLLGVVVMNQVRNGLLDAKVQAARSQAAGGFENAQNQFAQLSGAGRANGSQGSALPSGTGAAGGQVDMGTWLTTLVTYLSSGGAGDFSVVAMAPSSPGGNGDAGGAGIRGSRTSGDVSPSSIPAAMQQALQSTGQQQEAYTQIVQETPNGVTRQAGVVIGRQLSGPGNSPYQLYFLFPFQEDAKTLGLVTDTLAIAGVFVVILLGAIAWLVTRQVVAPVRIAAGISERLAAGRLEERMKVSGTDDIARLGESFNKMAAALQTQIRQLEELSRVQRRFVSDVSHELRTPLTTVRMAADLLYEAREDFQDVSATRSAELLQAQLDRFESLLSDLLEISRFDAGAAVLEAEPVDLREVVQRVVDAAEPLARRKGSPLRVVGAEHPVVAEVDPRRIERVLRNLVVNALEHGEGREVSVRLAAAEGAVAVGVRDYGIGLKPGEASRVFHRFWRADPARARTTGGTGLGLSIALEDANLHGGWLQAWGEPGGGSQFRLTLPRNVGADIQRSPMPLEPEDSRRNRGLGASGVPYQRSARPVPAAGEHPALPAGEAGAAKGGGPGAGGPAVGRALPGQAAGPGPAADASSAAGYGAGVGARRVVIRRAAESPAASAASAGPGVQGSARGERASGESAGEARRNADDEAEA